MSNELKPCPFCGADAELRTTEVGLWKIIANHDDKCWFNNLLWSILYDSKEEAIEAWNRRANDEG